MQITMHKAMRLVIFLTIVGLTANVCMGAAWKTEKIGIGTKGNAEFKGDEITVTAITGDIWDAADTAMYVYKEASGDMEISARVAKYEPANPDWGKAGLMIRQSVDADAANAFINLTKNNGLKLIHRDTKGGPTGPEPAGAPYNMPIYLKLTRQGDTLTAFTSNDGKTWKEAGGGAGPSADIKMTGKIVAGMALSSNDPKEGKVFFDMVDGTGDFARPVEPLDKLTTTWGHIKLGD